MTSFDILTATAGDLRGLLSAGRISSVALVRIYLEQIARHNRSGQNLRAVVAVAPYESLLEQAEALDAERAKGKIRSPAHGIPILVKDNICTSTFELPTTSGTWALKGMVPSVDGKIVSLLRDAGSIIIGKTNLSELGNMKGTNIMSGWSPIGGQTQSPYVRGGVDMEDRWFGHSAPGGSSSGSAVGVAAGFAPWSIGDESDASIVCPALRAALYGMKATVGAIDMSGTQSAGNTFISSGGLTKSVADLADLMKILIPSMRDEPLYAMAWKDIRIACVPFEFWRYPGSFCRHVDDFIIQSESEMAAALDTLEELGVRIVRNVQLKTIDQFEEDIGITRSSLAVHQCRSTLEKYLSLFETPLTTLEDFIEFNKEHAAQELPPRNSNQDYLLAAREEKMSAEEFEQKMPQFRDAMCQEIGDCLERYQAGFILAPGDSLLPSHAMASGHPIANVPLGFARFNGRPFGMQMVARDGCEGQLLKVMAAWETVFPHARQPPCFKSVLSV
ncbi:amidase signature domain-containing protein [Astrocystis sublimbata]|nr:amidase signature domain-containing protein [Astrocystis sublimbata]